MTPTYDELEAAIEAYADAVEANEEYCRIPGDWTWEATTAVSDRVRGSEQALIELAGRLRCTKTNVPV